jgi:hypothetical protein
VGVEISINHLPEGRFIRGGQFLGERPHRGGIQMGEEQGK